MVCGKRSQSHLCRSKQFRRSCGMFFVPLCLVRTAAARRPRSTTGDRFDFCTKLLASGDPTLLRRIANGAQDVFAENFVERISISSLSFFRRRAKRAVDRMFGKQRIGLAQRIVSVTRPPVLGRLRHHAGPQRIGFDIAVARENIAVAVEYGGSISPFPERSGAPVSSIESSDRTNVHHRPRLHRGTLVLSPNSVAFRFPTLQMDALNRRTAPPAGR